MTQETFITLFEQQKEPGLMVTETKEIEGFTAVTDEHTTLLETLTQGGKYTMTLTPNIKRETYDLLKQYTDRQGAISVYAKGTWKQGTIDTNNTRLLILTTTDTLKQVEQDYPIRQAVGMVFEQNK